MLATARATSMEPINEEEFEEGSLFPGGDIDDEDPADAHEGSSESSDELDDPTSLHASSSRGAMDFPGMQSESAKSSTLNVSLEDSSHRLHDADELAAAGGSRRRMYSEASQPRAVAQSLPVHTSAIRMGSSVPVNIPFMTRWNSGNARDDSMSSGHAMAIVAGAGNAPYNGDGGDFIPPHKMSQRDDLVFSLTGDAPNAAMKRDLLRHRNAVLRSTGFLETSAGFVTAAQGPSGGIMHGNGGHMAIAGSLPASAHMAAGMAAIHDSRARVTGASALSAALGSRH